MSDKPDTTPWQSHEIDIPPAQYFAEVDAARNALAIETAKFEAAAKPLRRKLWELEESSFYWRSKVRALEEQRQRAVAETKCEA